jgi:pimeloyl-ACP methyl ester carboxylesterase
MERVVFLAIVFAACFGAEAQTTRKADGSHFEKFGFPESAEHPNINWKLATLGGTQFWTDVHVEGGWRVQRNSSFGHFRLLDDSDIRQAWGTEQACSTELKKNITSGVIKPYSGKVVILLHGLCRTWHSMKPLAGHLESQGYTVIQFRYASSRQQVGEHARYLKRVIGELPPDVTEINFVGHSLGNIVVRHYVSDCKKSKVLDLDSRINRMVMIGPPNQGSRMARLLKNSASFKLIAGASGAELSLGWDELSKNLATPEFEFGIIAGNYGDPNGLNNFLLHGENDFTVSKWETMLPGADDFLAKPLFHSTMMHQTKVLEATTLFLEKGYFISKDRKQPIESLPEKPLSQEVK